MSLMIQTLNRGEQRFGFYFGGTHRILLGELPAMPTSQFCAMAGEVLLQLSPLLDEQSWRLVGSNLDLAFLRDKQTKADLESLLDLPELLVISQNEETEIPDEVIGGVIQTVSIPPNISKILNGADSKAKSKLFKSILANLIINNGWTATPYQNNPFVIEVDHVNIADTYQLTFTDFSLFASQVLCGGIFGWDQEQGMPKSAKDILAKLKRIW